MSKITNDGRLNPVWHRMLYSCTNVGYDNSRCQRLNFPSVKRNGRLAPAYYQPLPAQQLTVSRNNGVFVQGTFHCSAEH